MASAASEEEEEGAAALEQARVLAPAKVDELQP